MSPPAPTALRFGISDSGFQPWPLGFVLWALGFGIWDLGFGIFLMFSLHIDTARSWRGGQSQVRYTVLGLREIGQRAALVAHPDGELLRRMSEGLDLIPLAPRNEIDLSAALRL
jgi:hypothetical protein